MRLCNCRSHNGFLTRVGYLASERAADDYCDELVDGAGRPLYLDSIGSVSGPTDDGRLTHISQIEPLKGYLHGS